MFLPFWWLYHFTFKSYWVAWYLLWDHGTWRPSIGLARLIPWSDCLCFSWVSVLEFFVLESNRETSMLFTVSWFSKIFQYVECWLAKKTLLLLLFAFNHLFFVGFGRWSNNGFLSFIEDSHLPFPFCQQIDDSSSVNAKTRSWRRRVDINMAFYLSLLIVFAIMNIYYVSLMAVSMF